MELIKQKDIYLRNKISDNFLSYGTAGFRLHHEKMEYITLRTGFFLSIFSIYENNYIGCVITASHNPSLDNGLKIIDKNGFLPNNKIEMFYEEMINENNLEISILNLIKNLNIFYNKNYEKNIFYNNKNGKILVAKDNRFSGNKLMELIKIGFNEFKIEFKDLGNIPTALIYTLVYQINNKIVNENENLVKFYYDYFVNKYINFIKKYNLKNENLNFILDCANGIGNKFYNRINIFNNITAINTGEDLNLLNKNCGSEYVEKQKKFPTNFDLKNNKYGLSVDGDVDRLIYFINNNNNFELINGDKIICLISKTIKKMINTIKEVINEDVSFRVVTTAYSNGSLIEFLKENNIKYIITKTGVKNTHAISIQYDIGLYFEANGHGTLTIKKELIKKISENKKLEKIYDFLTLINTVYGDSFINHLLIDICLKLDNKNINDLNKIIKLKKNVIKNVKVKNRLKIINNDDNSIILEPEDIQNFVNLISKKFGCRVFIRPSGTEDLVKIYMEGNDWNDLEFIYKILKNYLENHKYLN